MKDGQASRAAGCGRENLERKHCCPQSMPALGVDWWTVSICLLRFPQAACHRLAAFARWVVARTGVLPHLQAAAAALGSSAAAQQLAGWGRWAAGLLLAHGASPVAAAKAAAKGVPLPRGPLQELLWGIEKRGGLDAAGAFSA